MKKPFKNTEFSESRSCDLCKKPLKKNLLAKIPNARLCYGCFYPMDMDRRGITVSKTIH